LISNTPDGHATGVVRDCVVSCLVLVTVYSDTIVQTLGTLSLATRRVARLGMAAD